MGAVLPPRVESAPTKRMHNAADTSDPDFCDRWFRPLADKPVHPHGTQREEIDEHRRGAGVGDLAVVAVLSGAFFNQNWPMMLTDIEVNAVNNASYAASNLIYEFASTFDRYEDYTRIEQLAQMVQATVIQTFVDSLKQKPDSTPLVTRR